MNPYQIIGVARNCTHEEVRQAFLLKVQYAHPDHGGDDLSFVELRDAYVQILREMDRRPRPAGTTEPGQTANIEGALRPPLPSLPPEAYADWLDHFSGKLKHRRPGPFERLIEKFGMVLFALYCFGILVMWATWNTTLWDPAEPPSEDTSQVRRAASDASKKSPAPAKAEKTAAKKTPGP
jgi:hypothetical protein